MVESGGSVPVARYASVQVLRRPRFRKPPYDPGRSDFPSPVLTLDVRLRSSRTRGELNADSYTPPLNAGLPSDLGLANKLIPFLVGSSRPPGAQSPFARARRYLPRRDLSGPVRGRYPSFIAHTGSCARPSPSQRLQVYLFRRVFAGCHQSLLRQGPSRRYLCNPCMGAWSLTPWRPLGAHARSFPRDTGLTSEIKSSAHQTSS